jgi:hypothetical protein
MTAMTDHDVFVTLGVDSHADMHVAAALDQVGRVLDTHAIPTTVAGYATINTRRIAATGTQRDRVFRSSSHHVVSTEVEAVTAGVAAPGSSSFAGCGSGTLQA